jgi:hypothetical protein
MRKKEERKKQKPDLDFRPFQPLVYSNSRPLQFSNHRFSTSPHRRHCLWCWCRPWGTKLNFPIGYLYIHGISIEHKSPDIAHGRIEQAFPLVEGTSLETVGWRARVGQRRKVGDVEVAGTGDVDTTAAPGGAAHITKKCNVTVAPGKLQEGTECMSERSKGKRSRACSPLFPYVGTFQRIHTSSQHPCNN